MGRNAEPARRFGALAAMSEVSFNAFVVSLATTAAVHFGDMADPATGRSGPVNLEGAGQAIEMLALLQRKTAGNLTEGEAAFLGQVLAELRRRLIAAHREHTGPVSADGDGWPPAAAT